MANIGCHNRNRIRKCAVGLKSALNPSSNDSALNNVSPNAVTAPLIPMRKIPKNPIKKMRINAFLLVNVMVVLLEAHQHVSAKHASRINVLIKCSAIDITLPEDTSPATHSNITNPAPTSASVMMKIIENRAPLRTICPFG